MSDQLYQLIKTSVVEAAESLGVTLQSTEVNLEHPANPSFGDVSSNIALAHWKKAQKNGKAFSNPRDFAEELKNIIGSQTNFKADNVAGPGFLNFTLSEKFLLKHLTQIIQSNGNVIHPSHANKQAIVEFSSPNIAKPFTIGHLRSTIIGAAVANLLEATGYEVFRDNHLGDWGTQFGKLIYAIKTWVGTSEKDLDSAISASPQPVKFLVNLYIKFHSEAEKNPQIEDEARAWFKKLESGDQEAKLIWQKCIQWSWHEFHKIYEMLDIHFSSEFNSGLGLGESFFEDKMADVITELKEKQLLTESEGAQLVFFTDDIYPPLMIIKKDGATLYATRDLAADKWRLNKFGKDILIVNEVGIEQSLYFQQLFETERMLGWVREGQRVHVKHGHFRFKDQKMSTRKGNVIWLEDVLEEAKKRALELSAENRAHVSEIAYGALKWNDLRKKSELDVVFDWDEILNMNGNSGPYIQYTYARAKSVLKKAGSEITQQVMPTDVKKQELDVLKQLYQFNEVVQRAASEYAPHHLCTYLFYLAQMFNTFYNSLSILNAEDEERKLFRLQLTKATSLVLQKGLALLGIHTVEQM